MLNTLVELEVVFKHYGTEYLEFEQHIKEIIFNVLDSWDCKVLSWDFYEDKDRREKYPMFAPKYTFTCEKIITSERFNEFTDDVAEDIKSALENEGCEVLGIYL